MNCLFWNVFGACKSGFRSAIKYMCNHHKVDILAIFEPRISGARAQAICDRLNFSGCYRVEVEGFEGGVWVLWKSDKVMLQVVNSHKGFVHAKISEGSSSYNFIAVYAPPEASRRREFWNALDSELSTISEPLIIGGDFNCIRFIHERLGGSGGLHSDSNVFNDIIMGHGLIDLGYTGADFTWDDSKSTKRKVFKRLDRVLMNQDGHLKWTNAHVRHLARFSSDHSLILLSLDSSLACKSERRPFRFEAAWMTHSDFYPMVEMCWFHNPEVSKALPTLKTSLIYWNRLVFGNVFRIKSETEAKLAKVQGRISRGITARLIDKEVKLKVELEGILEQEEVIWF